MVGGREVEGALLSDGKHVGVDVGDGDVDVGVSVAGVGMVEDAEGDVAGAAGDVENVLGLTEGCSCSGVERGDEVVPVESWVRLGRTK